MRRIRFGYLLPTRDQAAAGVHDPHRLVGHAVRAEALGYDSVWAGESPVTRPRADPLLVLAAVAQATRRVELGTAVLLPALRHPIPLAHQLATLDRLSGGRVIAGMGAGFPADATRAQFTALGVDFATRNRRLEESVEAMRLLWTGEAVSFQGEHVAFEDVRIAPPPSRPAGPPVWLAGGGPALRRVARIADGWLPYPPEHGVYADEAATIRETAQRPVTPALYATLCLDGDPGRARERLRASIERYYNAPLEFVASVQAMFAGTPEDAAAWLARYIEAGARHIVVRFATGDHEAALAEFAGRVRPLVPAEARS
ncbi:LLM class flavin-dependent oxidoreductase [Actinomadura parmotrematis]|uniref:LLM class flavin-dependent oxidoreductase n=1 Tax=Actinomadura parmotrematis TaxID=2864039 RepID=A0ABS7FNC7_9ACTN|nr:LLM class flavin-dependent oxidoreductase [Actinomadura parmotrematis]MBW8481889.1 LLM class flavin-dependent oxidoreductase [Actinomadura parmotrematis]